MNTFRLDLSFKNIMILKHSLERRINNDKEKYEKLKKIDKTKVTEEEKLFIKEHEEHLRCLDAFIEEMISSCYMHGRNIFGDKYTI